MQQPIGAGRGKILVGLHCGDQCVLKQRKREIENIKFCNITTLMILLLLLLLLLIFQSIILFDIMIMIPIEYYHLGSNHTLFCLVHLLCALTPFPC